jgi:hypothetical protein
VKLIIENDGSGDQSHCEKVMKHGYLESNEEKKNPTCAELSWTHSAFDASGSAVRFILCDCNAMDSFSFFQMKFHRTREIYNFFFFFFSSND